MTAFTRTCPSPRRVIAGALTCLALGAVTGCGGDEGPVTAASLSTDSFCSDFIALPPADQAAATARIAGEMGVPEPASPNWNTALAGRCAAAPDLKLGDFFNHFK